MTCRGWNLQIALYVEGDLECEMSRRLEGHLDQCEECRLFAGALRQSQAEIRQLRNDAIDSSVLNRVRANVLQQVRGMEEQRTWLDRAGIWLFGGFRWRHAILGSVALVVAMSFLWRFSSPADREEAPPRLVATIAPIASPPALVPPRREIRSRQPVKTSDPASIPASAASSIAAPSIENSQPREGPRETLVQIITDDPNVVIFWLIDQTGGF